MRVLYSFYSRPGWRAVLLFSFVGLLPLSACGRKRKEPVYREAPPQPVNPHSVTITWTASKSKVFGYNVYRSSGKSKPEKLTDGIVFGTEYVDHTAVGGQTYTYFVTAVDFKGVESDASQKFTVKVPTALSAPANAPAGNAPAPATPSPPKP